jgi:diadenylate cyclase
VSQHLQQFTERTAEFWLRVSNYGWGVLVELALIWLVVFLVFRFLRGTRGARVLKGVGFILIVATVLVAVMPRDQAAFARLDFLYGKFLTFAALALVIVFQPELRRALVRLGEAKLFRGHSAAVEPVVEEIVKAVAYLSRNKIGAIIAMEREVPLGGIVEAGTPLSADVTAEILQTIFWPGSALHDMGVVIRDDKILAAGVQFPLSEGDDIAQELGSRHRAAIGLSQEADSLVIVVSEESGAISLAERGQLIRKLSAEALRTMLRRGLVQSEEEAIGSQAEDEPAPDDAAAEKSQEP